MAILTSLIINLETYQQQAVIDLLLSVQDNKPLSVKQVGLIGCSIDRFPVGQILNLFKPKTPLATAAIRLISLHGLQPTDLISLKGFLDMIIDNEIDRRCSDKEQKTLFDYAEGEDETSDSAPNSADLP